MRRSGDKGGPSLSATWAQIRSQRRIADVISVSEAHDQAYAMLWRLDARLLAKAGAANHHY